MTRHLWEHPNSVCRHKIGLWVGIVFCASCGWWIWLATGKYGGFCFIAVFLNSFLWCGRMHHPAYASVIAGGGGVLDLLPSLGGRHMSKYHSFIHSSIKWQDPRIPSIIFHCSRRTLFPLHVCFILWLTSSGNSEWVGQRKLTYIVMDSKAKWPNS